MPLAVELDNFLFCAETFGWTYDEWRATPAHLEVLLRPAYYRQRAARTPPPGSGGGAPVRRAGAGVTYNADL